MLLKAFWGNCGGTSLVKTLMDQWHYSGAKDWEQVPILQPDLILPVGGLHCQHYSHKIISLTWCVYTCRHLICVLWCLNWKGASGICCTPSVKLWLHACTVGFSHFTAFSDQTTKAVIKWQPTWILSLVCKGLPTMKWALDKLSVLWAWKTLLAAFGVADKMLIDMILPWWVLKICLLVV